MRMGKILGYVVGGIVAVIVIVLLGVKLFVNPNDFKPRIAAAVKSSTGRDLELKGDIKLSVFPWIALEMGPASLGNPAGFGEQPMVSFQHASVRARFLPLLAKRIEVGRVEIDGLDLRLLKNAEGKGNWEGFGKSDASAPAPAKPTSTGEAFGGIAGIKISNSRLSYQQYVIENFNLETGAFVDKGVVPISVKFDANRGVANEHASVDTKLDFSADSTAELFKIAALNVNSVVNVPGNEKPLQWSIAAPTVDLDLKAQTLALPSFDVIAAGAHITGSVQGTSIVDALKATGTVTLAPLPLRDFASSLRVTLPKTRDAKALSLLSASSDFDYGGNAVHLSKVAATLDDTHLKGSLAVTNLDTDALQFELGVDTINLDRYLPPPAPPGAPVPPADAPKPTEANSKPLDANGTLSVGAVHFSPLDLTNVKVTLAAKDNVMHVFPLKAQVFGGDYSGDITLDSRNAAPAISMDEHLTGVDVGKIVASESKSLHVSGRGTVHIKATGRGEGADALMKTLNGNFDMNVANGAVEGIDLPFQLGRAGALLRRQPMPNAEDTKRTKFDALKMTAVIANGIATTHDLIISSPVLKITGQGTANLPTKGLDFALLADTGKAAGNLQIPVKITGSMTDPTVRPDVEALAKGALKQKAQGLIQDKLKGLFH